MVEGEHGTIGAFQGPISMDDDPESEEARYGVSDDENHGIVIYKETIQDGFGSLGLEGNGVVHELGHCCGCNHLDLGVMDNPAIYSWFTDVSLNRIRTATIWSD